MTTFEQFKALQQQVNVIQTISNSKALLDFVSLHCKIRCIESKAQRHNKDFIKALIWLNRYDDAIDFMRIPQHLSIRFDFIYKTLKEKRENIELLLNIWQQHITGTKSHTLPTYVGILVIENRLEEAVEMLLHSNNFNIKYTVEKLISLEKPELAHQLWNALEPKIDNQATKTTIQELLKKTPSELQNNRKSSHTSQDMQSLMGFINTGDFNQAEHLVRQKKTRWLITKLIAAYIQDGKFDRAEQWLQNSESSEICITASIEFAKQGQLEKAQAAYDQAWQAKSKSFRHYIQHYIRVYDITFGHIKHTPPPAPSSGANHFIDTVDERLAFLEWQHIDDRQPPLTLEQFEQVNNLINTHPYYHHSSWKPHSDRGFLAILMNDAGFYDEALQLLLSIPSSYGDRYHTETTFIGHYTLKQDYDMVRHLLEKEDFYYGGEESEYILEKVAQKYGAQEAIFVSDLLGIGEDGERFIGTALLNEQEWIKGFQKLEKQPLWLWIEHIIKALPAFDRYEMGLSDRVLTIIIDQVEPLMPHINKLREKITTNPKQ